MQLRPTHLRSLLAVMALLALPGTASATPVLAAVTPASVTAGSTSVVTGSVTPAVAGEQVQVEQFDGARWGRVGTVATTDAAGAWQVTFAAKRGGALRAVQLTGTLGTSGEATITVLPRVLAGAVARGEHLPFEDVGVSWRIAPATWPAGEKVRVLISIGGREAGYVIAKSKANGVVTAKVPAKGVGKFRASLLLPQVPGFAKVTGGTVSWSIAGARVGSGSSAAWNRSLRAALKFRGFHVPGGSNFDSRMGEAVIAFHKAYGRARTTTFEASDWKRLTSKRVAPRDRSAGLHIEIDKARQILMQVQDGTPTMIIHISSGATGNTPAGRHKVQWKGLYVPSLYGSLLYRSMAFQGAYAIHGYPSVPTTPASHGCVRVPMWIADTLYRRSPVDTPVFVYEGPGGTAVSIGRDGLEPDVPELTGVDVAPWISEGSLPA